LRDKIALWQKTFGIFCEKHQIHLTGYSKNSIINGAKIFLSTGNFLKKEAFFWQGMRLAETAYEYI
jgi:hypothetical protein